MRLPGPRNGGSSRRLLALLALAVVLSMAASQPAVGAAAGQSAPARAGAGDAPRLTGCLEQCGLPGALGVASIFPLSGDRERPERSNPELLGLDDERAGELFDALAAETARAVLGALAEEPRTAPEVAEVVDTSLQNVHYHLGNLEAAGAVAEVDVEYSSRGREMSVYAAACSPRLVVYDVE